MNKIAYLGPAGTYTEQAAAKYSPRTKRIECFTIKDVFETTASGKTNLGLVPIENIIEGQVNETLDNLLKYEGKLNMVDILVLPIQHALGALRGADIKKIRSQYQALRQCSDYLNKHYRNAGLIETTSTAKAIKEIAEKNLMDSAAIGSDFAMKKYGLKVIAKDIGNIQNNKTKFAILGNYIAERSGEDRTSMMIYPHRDRIGLLDDIITLISRKYKINMSSIHSRPDAIGGFKFYLELQGHVKDKKIINCIKDLRRKFGEEDIDIKIFGSYPKRNFIDPKIKTIGIIGGTGKMGGWFKKFFGNAGYKVLASGRKTSLTYKQCIKQSDVIIVNVPIKNTAEVIKKISPYFKKGQLIVDNTSIKDQPINVMLKNVKKDVEVLGMHTIFGEKTESARNQNIAFVHTKKSGEITKEFQNIFYKYGARVNETKYEEHDKQMALHQNLEHLSKISLAELIRKEFKDPVQLGAFSSPNSENTLITMGRILNSKPELLSEIQEFNKQAPHLIKKYLSILNELSQNPDKFEKSMKESIKYFKKSWIKKRVTKSKKIQKTLSEK